MQDASSGFAPVNGLNLYYEIHGEGQPLIMLHGGVSASEAFGQNLTELAQWLIWPRPFSLRRAKGRPRRWTEKQILRVEEEPSI